MSTIVVILLLVLLLLALIIVPFARQMIKDREELHSNPIEQKFSVLAQALSDALMDGEGQVTVFEDNPKLMNLMSDNKRNLLINFMYSTGNLTLTLYYKYFHNELVHKELYTDLRNADNFKQREIAKQFVLICNHKISEHQKNVTGSAATSMSSPIEPDIIPQDQNDVVSGVYSELSRLQKISVLILLYRIAIKGGVDEHKVLSESTFTLMQLQLNTKWDECKEKISTLDIYEQLKAADKTIIEMVIMSAMQLIANLGGATNPKLSSSLFNEFGKLGYSPKDIDEFLQKIELLGNMYGF